MCILAGGSPTTVPGLSGQSGELVVTSEPERCCLKAREASHEAEARRSVPGFGRRASLAPRSADSPRGKTARLGWEAAAQTDLTGMSRRFAEGSVALHQTREARLGGLCWWVERDNMCASRSNWR